jgi:hypothetical protein
MRFLQRYTARIRRLRPVFEEHLVEAVAVAVAVTVTSSVAGLLAAGLIPSRDAIVLVIALSACCAVVYVGYRIRPKSKIAARGVHRSSPREVPCRLSAHRRHTHATLRGRRSSAPVGPSKVRSRGPGSVHWRARRHAFAQRVDLFRAARGE